MWKMQDPAFQAVRDFIMDAADATAISSPSFVHDPAHSTTATRFYSDLYVSFRDSSTARPTCYCNSFMPDESFRGFKLFSHAFTDKLSASCIPACASCIPASAAASCIVPKHDKTTA
ncbi:hypothetical protein DUI87_19591 [Hirundo rustica rustica]|uniref:Uncharacterized protein n=1 Tax=Hirundo rustica rustica TaxID=333673 RepID=A0A3M0JSC7_HIRRU|nr:hypothetical protein DUI87_19591 [Hirundo rustica rustica]